MADRRRQIQLLIGSRWDYSFEPETFTGKVVRRGVKRGAAPTRWQDCARCEGTGRMRDKFGNETVCGQCQGRRGSMVDPYTSEPVVSERNDDVGLADLIRRDTKHVKCPDCQDLAGTATGQIRGKPCRRCDGTGNAPVPGSWLSEPVTQDRVEGDAEAALLNAITRRDQLGSFRELEQALAGISRHVNKPARFTPLSIHHVKARRLLDHLWLPPTVRTEASLTMFEASLVELALAYIDGRMPDPIRVPAAVTANVRVLAAHRTLAKRSAGSSPKALAQRDREILREVLRENRSVQWVASVYGLDVSSVYRILRAKEQTA